MVLDYDDGQTTNLTNVFKSYNVRGKKDTMSSIELFHIHVHHKLIEQTYRESPNYSNYNLYKRIIRCVLHMLHKKCYKNSKYFYYVFINKLITIYHFLNEQHMSSKVVNKFIIFFVSSLIIFFVSSLIKFFVSSFIILFFSLLSCGLNSSHSLWFCN
ncbi:hypothetical protein PFNF54_01669 [Plasmodium falciparum NF54]|uniref:Uncharacterized protein n=1 Tax=Plasmodium falciparum (isolate NF54) TaxID=5843 RepID=W7KIV4_PLAFO|nr:hypothetical protein PFNF54_01669 [Plasmodium falciparum NF54]